MQRDGDGWVECAVGHRHWGRYGAAGLLVRSGGLVLMQHRSAAVAHPGTWSVPGGARDSHETPEQAAVREAQEETDLDLTASAVGQQHRDDHGGWSYTTVVTRLPASVPIRPNWEGSEMRWVPEEEVTALALHPHFALSWAAVRLLR